MTRDVKHRTLEDINIPDIPVINDETTVTHTDAELGCNSIHSDVEISNA